MSLKLEQNWESVISEWLNERMIGYVELLRMRR